MPFSPEVRVEALVRSARHCVVCHRFKGVAVEVHHVVPESEGGANTIENAIVLCFDCHCFAGHYNDSHPKGSKYIRTELRMHKLEWERRVLEGPIVDASISNPGLHTSYLLTLDPSAIIDLFLTRSSRLPFDPGFIILNSRVGQLFKELASRMVETPMQPFATSLWGANGDGYYETEADFRDALKEYEITADRPIVPSDLSSGLVRSKALSFLSQIGVDISRIARIKQEYDEGGCDSGGWRLAVDTEQFCFLFSRVENKSKSAISIVPVIESTNSTGLDEIVLDVGSRRSTKSWPKILLEPNQSLFIPQKILFLPRHHFSFGFANFESSSVVGEDEDRANFMTHPAFLEPTEFLEMNPSDRLLHIELPNANAQVGIHEFDPMNTYLFDRIWMAGSCPHLFLFNNNAWTYVQELFSSSEPTKSERHDFIVDNPGVYRIAEIEFEKTIIDSLELNGEVIFRDIHLERTEHLDIRVTAGDLISVSGRYIAKGKPEPMSRFGFQRLALMRGYLNRLAASVD